MAIGAVPVKGFRQASIALMNEDELTYAAAQLVEAPQQLSMEEEASTKKQPGGDVTYDESSAILSMSATFRFGSMDFVILKTLLGSRYQLIVDGNGKKVEIVDRRTSDVPPWLKFEGLVRYIGSGKPNGDYHFIGLKGKLVGLPKITYQTEEYANVEITLKFFERADGRFYLMRLAEEGTALSAGSDVDTPDISATSVAEGATGVSKSSGTKTMTFDEPILFVAADWALYTNISSVLTEITSGVSFAIDSTGTIVTCTHGALGATTAHRMEGVNVSDVHGNTRDAATLNFTTGA